MLGFLHTSPLHVAVFEDLVAELAPGSSTVTVVSEALLERARAFGPDHAEVRAGLGFRLGELSTAGASIVVCTCSSLGAAAEDLGKRVGLHVVRVDRAMAEAAVAYGGPIVVLAALEAALVSTQELLAQVADRRRPTIVGRLVDGAWDLYRSGDIDGYHRRIAEEITTEASHAEVLVLGQASMAPAAELVRLDLPVLTSPRLAVEAGLAIVNAPE
jgi:Asp/Glu/hydantoin racemase